jgi:hypothetical protein
MLCNPGSETTRLTFTYYDNHGTATAAADLSIKALGSLTINLETLFSRTLSGGSMLLETSRPLAVFLLYDGTKTGTENWKAGLSAIPLD